MPEPTCVYPTVTLYPPRIAPSQHLTYALSAEDVWLTLLSRERWLDRTLPERVLLRRCRSRGRKSILSREKSHRDMGQWFQIGQKVLHERVSQLRILCQHRLPKENPGGHCRATWLRFYRISTYRPCRCPSSRLRCLPSSWSPRHTMAHSSSRSMTRQYTWPPDG